MPGKPAIGITGPDKGGLVAWLMTAWAVWRCGGKPVRIRPAKPVKAAHLDGVVIGGGSDVDPFHYGEEKVDPGAASTDANSSILDWPITLVLGLFRALFASSSTQDYDPDRDALESMLIREALYKELPILGICRGAQLMNVVLGGTLHQNIEHFYSEDTGNVRSILPRKKIVVTPGSRLYQVLQIDDCVVNALHDQSISKAGDQIVVSAEESTGVVQAIERVEHRFYIGVQWHPEYMPQSRIQQRLFCSLVEHASNNGRD